MNVSGLVNTPKYYYSISYWLSCMLFILQSKKRFHGWHLWGIQAFFLAAILTFMQLTQNLGVVFFIPTLLVTLIMMLTFLIICCDVSVMNTGYYCARAFIIGEFAASFEWQIYYFAMQNLKIPASVLVNATFLIIIYTLVYGIMYYLEKRYQRDSQNMQITKRELLSAVTISTVVYMISNLSYVYENTPFSGRFSDEIFNIRTLVDLGGVAILLAYHVQLGELQMKFEVEKLQNILNMQYENYQILDKSVEIVNQKYHDLKYQIALMRSEKEVKENEEYLDRMENEIKIYETQNKTGNKILDTILTGKSLYCQSIGIELTCVADGTLLNFMDVMDISTLFGNALDNAIESVRKLEEKEKRLIHLAVTRQKDFLIIRVENYFEGILVFENGLPATTKKDKTYHGYGLKSIQNTVKKYDGSVTINTNENWFELRILIPIL